MPPLEVESSGEILVGASGGGGWEELDEGVVAGTCGFAVFDLLHTLFDLDLIQQAILTEHLPQNILKQELTSIKGLRLTL